MSVYAKDKPGQVLEAAQSMLEQSCRPAQFVLVLDGPVPDGIRQAADTIAASCGRAGIEFTDVPLPENLGLGPALNRGLAACRHELVARMDADDISLPDRCKKQLAFFEANPDTDVLSGALLEFEGEKPEKEQFPQLTKKSVPLTCQKALESARLRNPVNHPCAMYRKSAVLKAGGYRSVPFFEDYDLWLRMLFEGDDGPAKIASLSDPLLLMRTDGMYERRGGLSYAGHLLRFRRSMYRNGYLSLPQYLTTTAGRLMVALIPPGARRAFYRRFLRRQK